MPLRKPNEFSRAVSEKRQKMPGGGIFYARYSVQCTREIRYPSQFESVEKLSNFGKPTAGALQSKIDILSRRSSRRIEAYAKDAASVFVIAKHC